MKSSECHSPPNICHCSTIFQPKEDSARGMPSSNWIFNLSVQAYPSTTHVIALPAKIITKYHSKRAAVDRCLILYCAPFLRWTDRLHLFADFTISTQFLQRSNPVQRALPFFPSHFLCWKRSISAVVLDMGYTTDCPHTGSLVCLLPQAVFF